MKNLIKIAQIFLLLIFLSSCKNTSNDELFIEDSEDQKSEKLIRAKNRIEVRYSCGEDGISEFINNGWVIVEEYTEEKICNELIQTFQDDIKDWKATVCENGVVIKFDDSVAFERRL